MWTNPFASAPTATSSSVGVSGAASGAGSGSGSGSGGFMAGEGGATPAMPEPPAEGGGKLLNVRTRQDLAMAPAVMRYRVGAVSKEWDSHCFVASSLSMLRCHVSVCLSVCGFMCMPVSALSQGSLDVAAEHAAFERAVEAWRKGNDMPAAKTSCYSCYKLFYKESAQFESDAKSFCSPSCLKKHRDTQARLKKQQVGDGVCTRPPPPPPPPPSISPSISPSWPPSSSVALLTLFVVLCLGATGRGRCSSCECWGGGKGTGGRH